MIMKQNMINTALLEQILIYLGIEKSKVIDFIRDVEKQFDKEVNNG